MMTFGTEKMDVTAHSLVISFLVKLILKIL